MIARVRTLLGQLTGQARNNPAVLKNFGALASIQISTYLLPLITYPYTLRVIGWEKSGVLNIAGSFNGYLLILTDYGFRMTAPRLVAIHRADRQKLSEIFTSVLCIKFCLMLLSFAVLCGVMLLNEGMRTYWQVQFIVFGLVIANLVSMNWFFQGMERMEFITALNLSAKVLYLVLLVSLVRTQEQFYLVPLLGSATEIAAGLVGMIIAMWRFRLRLARFSSDVLRAQLVEGWHTFISGVAINGYAKTPTVAVGFLHGPLAAGYYGVAERLGTIFQTFPLQALLQATYPRLASMYATKKEESYRLMQTAQRVTTIAYIAALPVVYFATPILIRMFAGNPGPEAVAAFRLLAVAIVTMNANAFRLQFLLVSGRHKLYSRVHIVLGLLGTIAVVASAKFFSYTGPPIALILVNLLILIWTMHLLKREMAPEMAAVATVEK